MMNIFVIRALCGVLVCHGILVNPVQGTILLRTGNYSFQPIADVNAQFGPAIPNEGISGHVLLVDPEDGCRSHLKVDKIAVDALGKRDGLPWIALIRRSHHNVLGDDSRAVCSFASKVENAAKAGAAAAIIYDDLYEGLLVMSKPDKGEDPPIPSVFISRDSGYLLKALLSTGSIVQVIITPVSDIIWMSMFASAFAGMLAMAFVLGAFYMVRFHTHVDYEDDEDFDEHGGRSPTRALSKRQLGMLPVVVFANDETPEGSGACSHGQSENVLVCAICLDQYDSGDKLRILPCAHRFHKGCIDEWLLSSSVQCPLCKQSCVTDSATESPVAMLHVIPQIFSSTIEAIQQASQRMKALYRRSFLGRNEQPIESEMGTLLPDHAPSSSHQVTESSASQAVHSSIDVIVQR